MTMDPDSLRKNKFVEIGRLISAEVDSILQRWSQLARQDAGFGSICTSPGINESATELPAAIRKRTRDARRGL